MQNIVTNILCFVVATLIAIVAVRHMRMQMNYRLGNEIDFWFTRHMTRSNYDDFFVKSNPLGKLGDSKVEGFVHFLRRHVPCNLPKVCTVIKPGPLNSHRYYCTYAYHTLLPVLDDFAQSLRSVCNSYFNRRQYHVPGRCVVHFRLGDFLKNQKDSSLGQTVLAPRHITNAVSQLHTPPTSFLLLTGGVHHNSNVRLVQSSTEILRDLRDSLAEIAPVDMSTSSADDDFASMVFADSLIVGLGSFGICACIANTGYRLSPAVRVLNPNDDPMLDTIPLKAIGRKWKLYDATGPT